MLNYSQWLYTTGRYVIDDGGRQAAGFKGEADDCVVRAIAIALALPYADVYRDMNLHIDLTERLRAGRRPSSSRTGVKKPTIQSFLADRGWIWTPTMFIGSGCTVHLRADELPTGRLIVSVSKHIVAVLDRVIHDTHDPSREGTRCVYGYWKAGAR